VTNGVFQAADSYLNSAASAKFRLGGKIRLASTKAMGWMGEREKV
jgi:hypothetical protein